MIFADTSILIDYFKGKNSDINSLFDNEEIAICGVVLAELLHGVKSDKEKIKILDAINELHWINIDETFWHDIGVNLNKLRKNGLTAPFQDVVIASLCIKYDIFLLSFDWHFERMATILKELKLYRL